MEFRELIGHQVVCSAFIEKDDKFLVVMCPKFRVWRVLGARAHVGETLEETLIRKMEEETGISFKNPKFIGFGQAQQFRVLTHINTSRLSMFFHIKTNEELNLNPEDAEDYKWVTIEELRKLENKELVLTDFFERNPKLNLKSINLI